MTTNKKLNETGWFYHAPYKPKPNQEPVGAPPPSQIPGLSNVPDEPSEEQNKKMWIKESDSDYIILAKQGGRPDLLQYRAPKPRSNSPQGYPRCEWYYHETGNADNAKKDPTEPYEFLLPDYMVHSEWTGKRPTSLDQDQCADQGPAPYAFDRDTVYAREEKNPTDKTVRLPELKPSGYGVRAQKQQGKSPVKHAPIQRQQPIKPISELDDGKLKYEPVRGISEEERPAMGKLLSHGYVSDWERDRDTWNQRQKRNQEVYDAKCGRTHDKMQTEYQSMARKNTPSGARPQWKRGNSGNSDSPQKHQLTEEERELFKLSKYKNVQSKTDSRRLAPTEASPIRQHTEAPLAAESHPYNSSNTQMASVAM